MKAAKVENTNNELRVWCERCCIRIAPNETRTVERGKTYHTHCHAKLGGKTKTVKLAAG